MKKLSLRVITYHVYSIIIKYHTLNYFFNIFQCGADFVKVQQKPPNGLPNDLPPFTRCVSVDGDADRVIYFYVDDNEKFHMLDGDRIATLVAG
jgi:hypothetical protein